MSNKLQQKIAQKRDAQLAEDWRTIADTPEGRRVIADLMVWGDVYNEIDSDNPVQLALQVGQNNFAKRIAYLLGYRATPEQFSDRAWDDTDMLDKMINHRQH
jgi:hypothetical protein